MHEYIKIFEKSQKGFFGRGVKRYLKNKWRKDFLYLCRVTVV